MRVNLIIGTFALVFHAILASPGNADETLNEVQNALDAANLSQSLLDNAGQYQHAAQAHRLAQRQYRHRVDVALPAALAYGQATPEAEESEAILTDIYAKYVAEYGKNSSKTLRPLYALAKVSALYTSNIRSRKLYKRAEKIIKTTFGRESLELASHFLNLAEVNVLAGRPMSGVKYARKVRKILENNADEQANSLVARSFFWSAKSLSQRGHGKPARKDTEKFVASVLVARGKTALEIADRKKLVESYILLEQLDKALEQSLEIGLLRSKHGLSEPALLYQPPPYIPIDAYKGGYVKYQFTVAADGTTRDIEVIARKGHPDLEDAGTTVIEQARYAPGVIDGAPVETALVTETLYWYRHGSGGGGAVQAGTRTLGPNRIPAPQQGQRTPRSERRN